MDEERAKKKTQAHSSSISSVSAIMPAPPPNAALASSSASGALGEALIPTINRLHDIFSTVREREREKARSRESAACVQQELMNGALSQSAYSEPAPFRQRPLDGITPPWLCSVV